MVTLKIIEENGWSKVIPIEKAITRVGRSSTNDICLASLKIAPVHLQILSSPDLPTTCRVVNLAEKLEVTENDDSRWLEPFGILDVNDKTELNLGEYKLVFEVPLVTYRTDKTNSIEANLSFSGAVLRDSLPLEGLLVLKNIGNRNATQFQVDLEGFPEDCYQIDPVPLLYAGAQEEVRVRFFHHTLYPPAGLHEVTFIINAPESYPGEEILLQQAVYVMPVFKQILELSDDAILQKVEEIIPPVIEHHDEVPLVDQVEAIPVETTHQQEQRETLAVSPVAGEQPHSTDDKNIETTDVLNEEAEAPSEDVLTAEVQPISEGEDVEEGIAGVEKEPLRVPVEIKKLTISSEEVKSAKLQDSQEAEDIVTEPILQNNTEVVHDRILLEETMPNEPSQDITSEVPEMEKITVERPKMKVVRSQVHDFWDEE